MALSLHQIVKHFNDVIAANQVGKPYGVMQSFQADNNLSPGEQAVYDKLRTAFLAENEDNIILISSYDEDAQMGGGGCTIPKSCVKKITHLREMNYSDYLPRENMK